jgi:Flp pilus assembly protein TadD
VNGASRSRLGRWWLAALVVLLACLPYVETPWFGFVDYDDPEHVGGNSIVSRGLTPRSVAWAFGIGADPAIDGWFNWPLTWLSHMADMSLFGAWAGGHHVVNVLLHAVNSVLVLALACRLGLAAPTAWLVAAVFAVHPAQVESVAWVSERKTVLCTCFMLLSMLAYLRSHGASSRREAAARFVAWNALGGLALLAKPLAVTLPCVLFLFDTVPLGRIRGPRAATLLTTAGHCVVGKLPLLACAIVDALWTVSVQTAAGAVTPLPWATRLAHAVVGYATYVRVFFWPVDLGCIHSHQGMPSAAELTRSAVLLGVVSIGCVVAARRGRPLALVGWCWFLGTLVPMVGLVTVGSNGWSDRYLYVPIIGLAIATLEVGSALVQWLAPQVGASVTGSNDPRAGWRPLGLAVASVWLTVLTIASWRQTSQWRDTATLAARTLAMSDDPQAHWHAWTWLARHHARERDFGNAERFFARAQSLIRNPETAAARTVAWHYAVGKMRMDDRRYDDAAREFAAVLPLRPDHVPARLGLAVALSRSGATERAAEVFEQVLTEKPQCAVAWVGLGDFHLQAGRAHEAARCLDRALAIQPDDAAAVTLRAWARLACGDRAGAEADAARRMQLGRKPDTDLLDAISRLGNPGLEPGS